MAFVLLGILRNTSTDVEKTARTESKPGLPWKHLHGRGEDQELEMVPALCTETPPRTWRRLERESTNIERARNTSTDVEKTREVVPFNLRCEKHLHGRGEDPDEIK